MKDLHFDYNTQRSPLVIREYGRHLQSMVEYVASIEDREKRNKLANAIVELMGQMNPGLRNVDEFRHKLWDHIYIISGGKLDVDSPYPKPDLDVIRKKPMHIGYPKNEIRFKHYGKNVERLIEKAVEMEDEEKRKAFTECIGNYMKLVHRNWNKDNANDATIKQDILTLSNGKLVLDDDSNLDSLTRSTKGRRDNYKEGNGSKRHGRRSSGGHRSNKNRHRRKNRD
ncbi:MAG: hypothetical protein KatS3mg031_1589 [Chitinophagales bacterium]|nr:MAG: hypothetical protein KatS3mg031_1589 [Chitinophagales bacterium]